MSALFRIGLFFVKLRLCQDQATCAQLKALAHTSFLALTYVAVQTFNGLILKVYINYLDALPQLLYAFKHLLNLRENICLVYERIS